MRVPAASFLAAFSFVTVAAVATAATSEGGNALTEQVKALAWKHACALPDADYEVDCAANKDPALCRFTRPDGTAFQPKAQSYTRSYFVPRIAAYNLLQPVVEEAGLKPQEVAEGQLPGDEQFASLAGISVTERWDWQKPIEVREEALAWVERELLPAPDQAMCGQTAQAVYDAAFQPLARASATAYAHLSRTGALKKVSLEALTNQTNQQKGKLWTMCERFGKAQARKGGDPSVWQDECRFWLRRAAVGQHELVARALGTVLARYDEAFYRKHARTLTPRR